MFEYYFALSLDQVWIKIGLGLDYVWDCVWNKLSLDYCTNNGIFFDYVQTMFGLGLD